MRHDVIFSESVDQTLANITPLGVTDGETIIKTNGDDMTVPRDLPYVAGAIFGAPAIDSARLVAPSLYRRFTSGGPDFSPINVGAEPLNPFPWHDYRNAPIQLVPDEKLNVQIANSGAGSAEDAWAILALVDGPVSPAPGPWMTYKFVTAASALTAEDLNSRSITPAQTLLKGKYAVGGGFLVSTSARWFRLNFPGQAYRCGGPAGDVESDTLAQLVFRNGGMGVWGVFDSDNLPTLEIFADATDNEVQELYLDLIPLGADA